MMVQMEQTVRTEPLAQRGRKAFLAMMVQMEQTVQTELLVQPERKVQQELMEVTE